ncbi:putative site-specific integrase-resolvase [Variovorax boronicumulans]|uniref:hypothetical protein n=1 Tax=Variovorax boronicumulans TaxID=436515 RepID=UPI00278B7D6A|nr:hypothetical protein [Variovorax boronicumulans]MDP9994429.1 putative site-specific integrase-resolvase [Variovorax boronicumulans]MDQ0005872.1 putative site-specific integrase-resolvase [Variovorax boronicumulans]
MTKAPRSSTVISARVSSSTKASFSALAAHHQLSGSSLLAKMVHEVIGSNGSIALASNAQRAISDLDSGVDSASRITLRLRPGDRIAVARRAHLRSMRTGSYLALLIHNHVHASAVLPPDELTQIQAVGAQLASLSRQLRVFGMTNNSTESVASELGQVLTLVRREVESAREATAAIVRRNLISWETGGGSHRG